MWFIRHWDTAPVQASNEFSPRLSFFRLRESAQGYARSTACQACSLLPPTLPLHSVTPPAGRAFTEPTPSRCPGPTSLTATQICPRSRLVGPYGPNLSTSFCVTDPSESIAPLCSVHMV
eukprot:2285645-Amphidinium_carterae.1